MNINHSKILSLSLAILFTSSFVSAKNIEMKEIKPQDTAIPAVLIQKQETKQTIKPLKETADIKPKEKTQEKAETPAIETKTDKETITPLSMPLKTNSKDSKELPQNKINNTEKTNTSNYLPRAQTESGTIFDAIRMQQKDMENK